VYGVELLFAQAQTNRSGAVDVAENFGVDL
jgi:hypothetical protein